MKIKHVCSHNPGLFLQSFTFFFSDDYLISIFNQETDQLTRLLLLD